MSLKSFDSRAIGEIRNEISEMLNVLREMKSENTVVLEDVKSLVKNTWRLGSNKNFIYWIK